MHSQKKICVILNIGPHYRYPIYKKMDEDLNCDFYIGDYVQTSLNVFDYKRLKGHKRTLHNKYFGRFYWQRHSVGLIFKPYLCYVLTGELYCLSTWLILFLAKIFGKKTVAWTHGWYGRESFLKKQVKKIFFALFDKIMVYGEYAIDLMLQEGFSSEKLYCIANSLDSDKEKALRETLHPSNIYSDYFQNIFPTIIYCGRIQKVKKLEELIDSVRVLKEEGVNVNVVIVGKDDEGIYLEDYAKACGVEKQLWLYGPCYDDRVLAELFYNAHVCVSPGNVGLTAIHSLSFGCPVVTHDNFTLQMPEFEVVIPDSTGDFFAWNDVDDLARIIKKWVSLSPQQRIKVRKASFEEIDRKWNIHYQIKVMRKVLDDLKNQS